MKPLFLLFAVALLAAAQNTQPPPKGGFVPGQKRAPEDAAEVSKGKTLFQVDCRGCHGPDLRGGDMGGPNLLRSQATLTDQHGELIVPIIHGSRQKMGMPAINVNDADAGAIAAYVRSVVGAIEVQGMPPSAGHVDPDILVGNAGEGKAYFNAKCISCHAADGDIKAFVSSMTDQKKLQTGWVSGGRSTGELTAKRTPTAEVALASGEQVSGLVARMDEFLITLQLPDGTQRSFDRVSDTNPKVVIHDPMGRHRQLLGEYSDKDIHDVTAYLETLK